MSLCLLKAGQMNREDGWSTEGWTEMLTLSGDTCEILSIQWNDLEEGKVAGDGHLNSDHAFCIVLLEYSYFKCLSRKVILKQSRPNAWM